MENTDRQSAEVKQLALKHIDELKQRIARFQEMVNLYRHQQIIVLAIIVQIVQF